MSKISELHNSPNFESIVEWFSNNGDVYLTMAKRRSSFYRDEEYPDPSEFKVEITYLTLRHGMVSNSHSCPKDGVTNFTWKPDRPRAYPGWEGRIEFRYSHDLPGWASDPMRALRIHTGTGGGISKNRFGYGVKFFDADWPMLSRDYTFELIKNPNTTTLYHTYGEPDYFER